MGLVSAIKGGFKKLWDVNNKVAKGFGNALGIYQTTGGDNSDYAKNRLVKTVRDAQAAGIHPLYAIGSGGFTPAPQFTGSEGFGGLGDAISQMSNVSHMFSSERAAKQTAGIEARVAESVIERNRAAANLDTTQSQLALSDHAMNLEALRTQQRDKIGVMLDEAMSKDTSDLWGPKTYPQAMIQVQFPDGKRMWIPNQNVMETGELIGGSVGVAGASKSIGDWISEAWAKARANGARKAQSRERAAARRRGASGSW